MSTYDKFENEHIYELVKILIAGEECHINKLYTAI